MPLRVHCPTGHVLMVTDERLSGKEVKCPRCQEKFTVPVMQGRFDGDKVAGANPATPPVQASPPPANGSAANGSAAKSSPPPKANPPANPQPAAAKPLPANTVSKPANGAPLPPKPVVNAPVAATPAVKNPPTVQRPQPTAEVKAKQVAESNPAAAAMTAVPPVARTAASAPPAPLAAAVPPPPVAAPPVAAPPVEAPPVAAAVPADPPVEIVPPAAQVAGSYFLAGVIFAVAMFSMSPAFWELWDYSQAPDTPVDTWAILVFAIGLVLIGYALFVAQLPDWTSAWVVSLIALLLAGSYGVLLGVAVMSSPDSALIHSLQLSNEMANQKLAFWAIAMISTTSLLSWYAGHCSTIWHRAEFVMRRAGLAVQ